VQIAQDNSYYFKAVPYVLDMYNNEILDVEKKITEKDLRHVEQKFKFKYPEEVREHFLMYNGGYPKKAVFNGEGRSTYEVNYFIPIKSKDVEDIRKVLELLRDEEDIIPSWLIPFADDIGGDLFCFSTREIDNGAIYYYSHEFDYGENPEEHITYLAGSLKEFINALVEDEEADIDE